jgi:hypothetical protein
MSFQVIRLIYLVVMIYCYIFKIREIEEQTKTILSYLFFSFYALMFF